MKKVYCVATLAVAVISFASCGNKAKLADKVDTAIVVPTATDSIVAEAPTDAQTLAKQLASKLSAKDGAGVAALLAGAQTKVVTLLKTTPVAAKEYVTQLQEWVKNNDEAVKSIIDKAGDSAVAQSLTKAVSAVKAIDPSDLATSLKEAVAGKAADI